MVAERWGIDTAPTDPWVTEADFVHARLTETDEQAFCEHDGRVLPFPSLTLVLSHPGADSAPRPVDCPDCLEWMHA